MTNSNPVALDYQYRKYVADDVRGNLTPKESAILRSPDNVERRISALIAIKGEVEVQLANHRASMQQRHGEIFSKEELTPLEKERAWTAFRAEMVGKRVRSIRFLRSVEEHILACRELQDEIAAGYEDRGS